MVLQGCLLGIHPPLVRSSVMSRKQLIFFEVQQFWLTTKLAQLKDNATWCNFSDQVLLFKNILVLSLLVLVGPIIYHLIKFCH